MTTALIFQRNKKILIVSLLMTLVLSFFLLAFSGNEKVFDYQHTKALCEKNTCRDYLITCSNSKIISMAPISGFVSFSDDWQDTRAGNSLC